MKKHYKFSPWLSTVISLGVTIGILLVFTVIYSWISVKVGISDAMSMVLVGVIAAVSWFVGAFILGIMRRQNGLIWGMVHAGCMFVLLLIISVIVNGSNASIFCIKSLLYALLGALISGFGSVFGVHFALKRR